MPRRSLSLLLALATAIAALGGCTPAPAPVATDAHDPSNPSAPEGAPQAIGSAPTASADPAARGTQGLGAHDHGAHGHGTEGQAPRPTASGDASVDAGIGLGSSRADGGAEKLYACPMHPSMMSRSEGLCPICNMKLVPKR